MSTHTQGQWRLDWNFIVAPDASGKNPDVYIATIADEDDEGRIVCEDEQIANGKLIAAAPDLLAALEQCLPLIDAYRRNSGGDGDLSAMNARAAIKKARCT